MNASHDGTLTRVAVGTRTCDSHTLKAKLLHKPSFQCYTTCEVILIQPRISHQSSLTLRAEFEWCVKQFLSISDHL